VIILRLIETTRTEHDESTMFEEESRARPRHIVEKDDESQANQHDERSKLLQQSQEQEEVKPIVMIHVAAQMFMDSIFPPAKEIQRRYQPLLFFPTESPRISELCSSCGRLTEFCRCCCASNENFAPIHKPLDEKDLLSGSFDAHVEHLSSKQESEFETYLTRSLKASPLNIKDAREDGIYITEKPYLADLLLRGEDLSPSLDLVTSSQHHLHLSRATQRTLRELKHGIERENLRQAWMKMLSSNATEGTPLRPLAPSTLLNWNLLGPVANISDDVIDWRCLQPVFPEPNIAFGGVLGNWDESAPAEMRLGNFIPKGLRNIDKRSILRLHLQQLNILDHPLMIPEERARLELERIFIQYRAILEERVFSYLVYRIDSLMTELHRLVQVLSSQMQAGETIEEVFREESTLIQGLVKDLVASLSALVEVFSSFTALSKALYAQWKSIQELRHRQGFISTKIRLLAQHVKVSTEKNAAADKATAKQRLAAEEEDKDSYPPVRNADVDKWRQLQAKLPYIQQLYRDTKMILGDRSVSDSNPTAASKPGDDYATIITQAVATLRSYSSPYPDTIFQLSEDVDVTPDVQVPAEEAQRRRSWQYFTWMLSVQVDNQLITSSKPCKVQPFPYHLSLQQSFEIRVSTAPRKITVGVFSSMSTSHINTATMLPMASFTIPTSLHDAKTVTHVSTPIIGWFTASSEEVLSRPSANLYDWLFAPPDPSTAARFVAALLCSVEYDVAAVTTKAVDGIRPDEVALIPDRSSAVDSAVNAHSVSSFARERDFQALLPDVLYLDPNDPKNDSLLYTKLQGQQRLLDRDVFLLTRSADIAFPYMEHGFYYDNYTKMKLSDRLQLLSIRNRKPFLFTEPIPLADDLIAASDSLKEVLSKEAPSPDLLALIPAASSTATLATTSIHRIAESLVQDDTATDYPEMSTKNKVNEFIQRVRHSQVATDRKLNRKAITTSSVVAERDYLSFPAALDNNDGFLPPRKRALKPKPRPRIPMAQQVQACNILIQVVGARNIPLRVDVDEAEEAAAAARNGPSPTASMNMRSSVRSSIPALRGSINNLAGTGAPAAASDNQAAAQLTEDHSPLLDSNMFDESKLREKKRARTFVEVSFQEQSYPTTTCEGATPIWKQLLTFPFHPPADDFTPSNLLQVQDEVIFTLFDEVYEDDREKTGFLEGESTERIDKRFLGRFTVPFTTLYKTGRVEGLFRLNTPCFNFGYNHLRSKASSAAAAAAMQNPNELLISSAYQSSMWTSLFNCDCLGGIITSSAPPAVILDPTSDLMASTANKSYISSDIESELSYFSASDSSASFIKVLITLDPFLVSPPSFSTLDRYEILTNTTIPQDRVHVPYARWWLNSLKSYGGSILSRSFKIMATNSSGQDVLLCRYLTPQRPPTGFNSRRSCIHLVSMIPFLTDSLSFSADVDIWCTAKQTWEIGAGDEEEHAVLLYNYLYYLAHYTSPGGGGADAGAIVRSSSINEQSGATVMAYPTAEQLASETVFLVQGNGIPEGETVYVMLRIKDQSQLAAPQLYESKNYLIINPSTGHCYCAADSSCPLKAIHLIATPYNLYANIQATDHPKHLLYDLQNPRAWRSFFHPQNYPYPTFGLHSVQEEVLYKESNHSHAVEIENNVKEAIRVNYRRWRSKRLRSATTFHPDACAVVTETLARLEEWKRYGLAGDQDTQTTAVSGVEAISVFEQEIQAKLRTVLRSRVLHGFPINLPYTDTESILAEIKSYCIHEIKHPEVQFVLGVRAIPIVNNIVSLWIYIGTLETTGAPLVQYPGYSSRWK
jgi:hypothetical protein